jgi:four helix bundle protein
MNNEKLGKKDIVERTFKYAIRVVKLANSLPKTPAGFALAGQVVRSGTSVGANLEEAQSSISKKEFILKVQISLKEARETCYWLKVITESGLVTSKQTVELLDEGSQLVAILSSIVKKAKDNF